MFPDRLRVSSFSGKVPTLCLDSGIVSPLRLRWIKGGVLRCNLPPSFRQNDRGLLRDNAVTRGWNGHRIRVSTQSELWRKNSPADPAGIQTRNLSITALLPTSYSSNCCEHHHHLSASKVKVVKGHGQLPETKREQRNELRKLVQPNRHRRLRINVPTTELLKCYVGIAGTGAAFSRKTGIKRETVRG